MTPVQQKVLSDLPNFTADCLVQAKTGTGKTIAFLLPALQSLLTSQTVPSGQVGILILSPTRELALQIAKECDQLTPVLPRRIECHTAFGGTQKASNLSKFMRGQPTVLVATPGRLNDYLSEPAVAAKFSNIRTLILDEADTMLEAGFLVAINDILKRLPPKARGWQGMCFSATMPEKIKTVLSRVLKSDYTHITTVDPNEIPTIEMVTQFSVTVPTVSDTYASLYALIQTEWQASPHDFKAIIFGTTANGVALMAKLFENLMGHRLRVYQLQSRLSQPVRTRTTNEFKEASSGLMFASDVIGRGMDFPNTNLVIQVGLPSNGEQYVHRVGRTARAGNEGRAVVILNEREAYFLRVNKHLPINPYPNTIGQSAAALAPVVQQAFTKVDESSKAKAYQAWLGFHKTFTKQLRVDNEGLVQLANDYAATMGCPEPPMMDKKVVGKMGLKGMRGLNVGQVDRSAPPPRRQQGPSAGGRTSGQNPATANGKPNGGRSRHGKAPAGGQQEPGRVSKR